MRIRRPLCFLQFKNLCLCLSFVHNWSKFFFKIYTKSFLYNQYLFNSPFKSTRHAVDINFLFKSNCHPHISRAPEGFVSVIHRSVVRRSVLRLNVTYRTFAKNFAPFLVYDNCRSQKLRPGYRRVSPNNGRTVSPRDCVKVPFYWAVFHRADTRNRARVTIRRDWYSRPLPIGRIAVSRRDRCHQSLSRPRDREPRETQHSLRSDRTSIANRFEHC